jgi:hypothetical protein
MAEPRYRRLTRGGSPKGMALTMGRCTLWLGEDHILSVESTGYTERYKRFYFRDIQALVLTQTSLWLFWALALGGVAVVLAAIALFSGEPVLHYIIVPVSLLFFIGFIYNFAAGPTCDCELRTAVQSEPLASLNRVRRARRVLGRVRPLITAAQGELAAETLAELPDFEQRS